MLHPNYDIISEDFRNRRCGADSDFTYLLRMTLFRASNEADRRYYLCAGETVSYTHLTLPTKA